MGQRRTRPESKTTLLLLSSLSLSFFYGSSLIYLPSHVPHQSPAAKRTFSLLPMTTSAFIFSIFVCLLPFLLCSHLVYQDALSLPPTESTFLPPPLYAFSSSILIPNNFSSTSASSFCFTLIEAETSPEPQACFCFNLPQKRISSNFNKPHLARRKWCQATADARRGYSRPALPGDIKEN